MVTLSQQQGGARVIFGNLLTLPVNDGLLYVEPFYIQGQSTRLAVPAVEPGAGLVRQQGRRRHHAGGGVEEGGAGGDAGTGGTGGTGARPTPATAGQSVPPTSVAVTPPTGARPLPADEAAAVKAMDSAVKELDAAKKSGDLGQIGAASQKLEEAVNNYLAVVAARHLEGIDGAGDAFRPRLGRVVAGICAAQQLRGLTLPLRRFGRPVGG